MPASMAICLTPPEVLTASTISGGNSECISCGTLSSCSFQRIFRFLTLPLFRIVSFCCQAVRLVLPPSVSQSAAASGPRAIRIAIQNFCVVILRAENPFYCNRLRHRAGAGKDPPPYLLTGGSTFSRLPPQIVAVPLHGSRG